MTPHPAAAIELHALTKHYERGPDRVEVLRGVDLKVAPGEFLAMMGPSGSGKTTLLHLIGGLDRPSGGLLRVGAARIDQLSERALCRWRAQHVGFVFQSDTLIPALGAARNVELPLLRTGLPKRERRRRVSHALSLAGLENRSGHRPRELSGGELQRVGIARALVADPELLLCDEPTGDLDRERGDAILLLLRTLVEQGGKTIVMVTHDPRAAAQAERVVALRDGRIEGRASP